MLLAVVEDSATLRSDTSAVYGFSGKSDTMRMCAGLLFFFAFKHKQSLFPENLNALNLGFGQSPMSRRLHP